LVLLSVFALAGAYLSNFNVDADDHDNYKDILGRIHYVAKKLGLSSLHVKSVMQHMFSEQTFKSVLNDHNTESQEQLQTQGTCSFIDHTKLSPEATASDISKLCSEAITNNFAAVCVNGTRVDQAVNELKGTSVAKAAVVGFPLGANSSQSKVQEVKDYINKGVDEIDYVIDVGRLKDGDYKYILPNLIEIQNLCKEKKVLFKVIIEICLLTRDEIIDACILCRLADVDYVKTSTGMGKPVPPNKNSGADPEIVRLMKQTVGKKTKVKASGGISDPETMGRMIQNGASRIGTSSGVKLNLTPDQARTLFPENNENNY